MTVDHMYKMENGVKIEMLPAEEDARRAEEAAWAARPFVSDDVNAERARRVLRGTTVTVPGVGPIPLQGRDEDARNLQALAFAASLRIAAGDTSTPTTFHDADNVDHQLMPLQMLALWQGAAAYVSAVYAASWAIKAVSPIPLDYVNDERWP